VKFSALIDRWRGLTTARKVVVVVVVILVLLLARNMACRGAGGQGGMKRGGFAVSVEVAAVERGPIRHIVRFVGSAEPFESVTVLPKISGILSSFPVQIGDWVDEGDVIATIDDAEFGQRLDQARANLGLAEARLERSRINLKLAGRELERVESMAESDLISDQQLDLTTTERDGARADVQLAEADVTRARAAWDEARTNYEYTSIRARMSGSIDKRQVDAGTLISPNTPLCTIVRTDPAKVVLNVPESDIGILRVGGNAEVSASGGTIEVQGRVERIAPTVDAATRTMAAEIVIDNPDGTLRPGMYTEVSLLIEEKASVLLVPEFALVRREDRLEVIRVSDGTAEVVQVTVGIISDGVAEVVDGVEEDALVVVRGQYLVNDGDPVRYETPGEEAEG
jgi:RND family efflux transporter MFP subunit